MKKYILIIITAVLVLLPTMVDAQEISCRQVSPESCDPGHDGAASLTLSNDLDRYCTVEWTTPKGQHFYGKNISGLEAGAYSVKVIATACNKPIFQDVVIVERDEECSIHAAISASTNTAQCGETPTATLTASASGGTPPYRYSWGSNVKTVSGSGTYGVTVTDANGYVGSAKVRIDLKKEECSQDPNELDGPLGYGDDHYVSIADRMHYTILFENDPDFATAPASRVRVTYPIPSQQSIASVRLADFGFGSFVFNVPNNTTSYTKRLDVSDSLGVWVDVTAGIDMANNQIFWIFQSVDPATGFEPASSQMGFLLVNDSLHHGEGYVSFSVLPKNNLASGDTVSVDATIVFDDNTAINTNAWKNTFDAVPPTSHLTAQTTATDSMVCNFTFTAADDPQGSGVDNIELMVSLNDAVYTSVGYYALTDTAHYTLVDGNVYRFISRATDNVGNQEAIKTVPDTVINNNTAPVDILLSNASFMENATVGTLIGNLSSIDNDITLPFVYELVSGTGDANNALFYIQGNELYTNASYSCTGVFDYSIRIRTTDITGLSFEKEFALTCIQENYPYSRSYNQNVCQGSPYTFGNRQLTVSGTYTDSLLTVRGCDSVITVNLTVNPVYHATQVENVCVDQSFAWTDHSLSLDSLSVGTSFYYDTMYTQMGCDSTFALTLNVHPTHYSETTADICENAGYTWTGHGTTPITRPAGTYTVWDSLQTSFGCDSVFMLALTVRPTSSSVETATACDSYTWHSNTYTASTNTPTFVTTNSVGCDSTVTLHLTINQSSQTVDNQTACDTYTWHGSTYTASTNTPTYSTTNAVGCDSTVTLHLTLNHSTTGVAAATACDTYTWHGNTYTASTNTPTFQTTNAAGCDSTVTLHLTINNSTSSTVTATACDTYTWHGTAYTTSTNTPTYTTTNAVGCDSVVTLHLTINNSSTTIDNQTACNSYTWHGTTYTSSTNTPTYSTTNAAGCDSTVTLNLTVNYSNSGIETVAACNSYTWHGTTYTASTNTPTYTSLNAAGCDSVTTLHLTISQSLFTIESITACDSYTWHGTAYTASTNTPTYSTTTIGGCDSTVTLHLTINNSTASTVTATACDTYTWHGTAYTASTNTPTYQTTNAAGCDSTVTLHLTINSSTTGTETVTACDSYTWHGTAYTTSTNTPTYSTTNSAGCDSTVTLHLTINSSTTGTETVTACDSYTWHGTAYTTSTNTPTYSTTNANGCDSTVTLHLIINSSTTGSETATACDSYTWHGTAYTASTNTPTYTTSNAAGCDSVVTLNLTINYSTSSTETATACDSYTWHGTAYTASTNTPTYSTTNAVGCDSIVTLNLTINYSTTATETVTACDSYTWSGTSYTSSTTTPTYTTTNAAGCDSTVTLHLTINLSTSGTETVTACDSYTWYGTDYTSSSNTPTYTSTNVAGCDSVITLDLTINYSTSSNEILSACDSLEWHGTVYTESTDTPSFVITNAVGCDSTITLHLTINYSSRTTIFDTATNSYEWNGETYTESGEYVYEGQTEAGCDSIVILQLTINQVGIADVTDLDGITIYPNPTTGKLTIGAEGVLKVEVFDYSGRQVATFVNTNQLDISQLPTGTYALRIFLQKGNTVRRVIKR